MLRPLVGHADDVADLVDATARQIYGRRVPLTGAVARQVQQAFMQRGYDGMIIRDAGGDGIDYVVAFQNETVKVVQE